MTIGDILAVIAATLGTASAWGALVLITALICPARTARARTAIETRPGRCFGQGTALAIGIGVTALIVMQNSAGPVKILAGALWGALALMAAVGCAGIAQLAGERIGEVGSHMTPFARMTRGVALFVGAGLTPIVGWFVVTPLAALIGIGAAFDALRRERRAPRSAPIADHGSLTAMTAQNAAASAMTAQTGSASGLAEIGR